MLSSEGFHRASAPIGHNHDLLVLGTGGWVGGVGSACACGGDGAFPTGGGGSFLVCCFLISILNSSISSSISLIRIDSVCAVFFSIWSMCS